MMPVHRFTALLLGASLLAACNPTAPQRGEAPKIKVRGPEQDKLHQLPAFDLAIALKRAIYDAGYKCQRLTDGGFVGTYQNMDIWMAKCADGKAWAVFAGPDGSAQVRDCKDVAAGGLPQCVVKKRPAGSFTERAPGKPVKRATFDG
ncbi:MAG: hypothetical protein ABIS38_00730 [Sphingomicrobium sp.]